MLHADVSRNVDDADAALHPKALAADTLRVVLMQAHRRSGRSGLYDSAVRRGMRTVQQRMEWSSKSRIRARRQLTRAGEKERVNCAYIDAI